MGFVRRIGMRMRNGMMGFKVMVCLGRKNGRSGGIMVNGSEKRMGNGGRGGGNVLEFDCWEFSER
ncbi:hypothetical protein [Bacillus altitudinis]|uniref:hypothetical protein n=1 Tax=Bacillus altitudinis TaxID=293387 RepID=UPI0011A7EFC4|nr:hypothetical protein [Bacillus altitudinis]